MAVEVVPVDKQYFQGYDLNHLENVSDEELWRLREDAYRLSWQECSLSVSQKTFMNSIYGATGNNFYRFKNAYTAADITAEGRNFIKTSATIINHWMHNEWHADTELHEKLRSHPELVDSFESIDFEVQQLPKIDYVLYTDTDSIYVEFDPLIKSIKLKTNVAKFIMLLDEIRVKQVFKQKFDEIITARHGTNFFKFDLETISAVSFFIAKKHYLNAYLMENGIIYDNPAEHIKAKGVELIQASVPERCRKLMSVLIKLIIDNKLNNNNFKSTMQHAFKIFSSFDFEQQCKLVSLTKYNEYITRADDKSFDFKKGTLAQYRGAAKYNHLLQKLKLSDRYKPIENQKIAWFMDTSGEPFSYHMGNVPTEILPQIDTYHQFDRLIVRPTVRFAYLAGINIDDVHSAYYEPKM